MKFSCYMYLPDVALHNLACFAKKGMLLIQERFHFFVGGIVVTTTTHAQFTEIVQ